jgi:predicted  nucleic acid-binding Zn-ribbon protein
MPAGKSQQSGLFYTLVIFVGLFVISTTVAVIYFIKAEGNTAKVAVLQNQINTLATGEELRKIDTLIGAKRGGKSKIGTMMDYLNDVVSLITGGPVEEASVEAKVGNVDRKTKEMLKSLAVKDSNAAAGIDPNTSLLRAVEKLHVQLNNSKTEIASLDTQLKDIQKRFDDAAQINMEKEKTLLAEKEKYKQQVDDVTKNYDNLKTMMEKTEEQRVQALTAQVNEEKDSRKELNQKLLKTQAELKMAQEKMQRIQEELKKLVPVPDNEAAAFKPDGKIIFIDEKNKIVRLNLGSDDRIYRGLTFSVYDRGVPLPHDGKGKAEIEIFEVDKTVSAARIVSETTKKNPIMTDDAVANLVWDGSKTNVFVIAGDFDLNGDGTIDEGAAGRIKALIEKWGGQVADNVSPSTDFLVLGSIPVVRQKPTFEETEADPKAMVKYENSVRELARYKEVQNQARGLNVPVFNYDRFLYLVGYKTLSSRPGAF